MSDLHTTIRAWLADLPIDLLLDELERAVAAAAVAKATPYAAATATWRRLDCLAATYEETVLCAAPDYPVEEDDAV